MNAAGTWTFAACGQGHVVYSQLIYVSIRRLGRGLPIQRDVKWDKMLHDWELDRLTSGGARPSVKPARARLPRMGVCHPLALSHLTFYPLLPFPIHLPSDFILHALC